MDLLRFVSKLDFKSTSKLKRNVSDDKKISDLAKKIYRLKKMKLNLLILLLKYQLIIVRELKLQKN